jgi:hypothetical protein
MNYKELTQKQVKELFTYSAIDGSLIRNSTNRLTALDSSSSALRTNLSINKKSMTIPVNQLIWLLCFGYFSKKIIFNKDFNKYNLRLSNLIEITKEDHYLLLLSYKNLMKYCSIKTNLEVSDAFIVKYLDKGKVISNRYFDFYKAKEFRDGLVLDYKRTIIELGGIPPC